MPALRFWPLQFAGWALFAVAMMLSRVGVHSLPYLAVHKVPMALLGIVVTVGLRHVYRRRPAHLTLPTLGLIAALSFVAALGWTAAYHLTAWSLADALSIEVVRPAVLSGTLYHAFVLIAWSVLYFGIRTYQALVQAKQQALEADALRREAELRALRYQLNPHFLHNTLNAISTLVVEEKGREARQMIARLGDFLRLTLDAPETDLVPLAQELDYVRRYLAIEQIRFGDRLSVHIDADADTLEAGVPNLLLQPLVENALRHGIGPKEQGGRLAIEARRHGLRLHVRIEDNGTGFRHHSQRDLADEAGVGLSNTRRRLDAQFGREAQLDLAPVDGGGTRADLRFPFQRVTSTDGALDPHPLVTNQR
ncbi:MAG: histidine kinase [Bacteroidota bacterium]